MNFAGSEHAPKSRGGWLIVSILILGVLVGGGTYLLSGEKTNKADLLFHTVKYEDLDLTVIERGTLESSRNLDVTCQVKASKGGNFSTIITWIIEDGTYVKKGQHIATLDDAALEDQERTQRIALSIAQSAHTKARSDLKSIMKEIDEALLKAVNMLRGSELDLEKYLGVTRGTLAKMEYTARKEFLAEMEKDFESFLVRLTKEQPKFEGEFRQLLDDVNGRIELAEAEHEQWKDKAAYSQRMVIKGYVTQSQAQADESRLNSATETLKKLRTERRLLIAFTAQKAVQNYCSLLKEAELALERTLIQNDAKDEQARSELSTKKLIEEQEQGKFNEIVKQIKLCRIYAPQDGLVVYYQSEQSRFGGGSQQSIIAQGEPVRENQKLLRIPDLRKMQVVARVHEAMISRINPDVQTPTGFTDAYRAATMFKWNTLPQLVMLNSEIFEDVKSHYHDRDSILASKGHFASIRVDAFNDRVLKGRVRTKAIVASQDYFSSDVKVYSTVVSIDDRLEGLRPGMSAEVTIQIEKPREGVLAIPVQSIVGGAELGDERTVYVMTDNGPAPRQIKLGLFNERMAEVLSGLQLDERVITNPKVLPSEQAKGSDPAPDTAKGGKGKGKGGPKAKTDAAPKP